MELCTHVSTPVHSYTAVTSPMGLPCTSVALILSATSAAYSSVCDGKVDAVLLDVGDDHRGSMRCFADGGGKQTNGAGAKDEDCRAFGEVGAVAGVHGDGERLDDGAEVE